jgi:hypothetical protein
MRMIIEPYKSFGPLCFGVTNRDECIMLLGNPKDIRINREGVEEYHYDDFIVRFKPETHVVNECTVLPKIVAFISNIEFTWDKRFLRLACEYDGAPQELYGFIVLRRLGIAVTGIHDNDESQMAITIFCEGEFDDLLPKAIPFEWSKL